MLGKDDTKEKQMQQELFNHLKLSKKNREIAEKYLDMECPENAALLEDVERQDFASFWRRSGDYVEWLQKKKRLEELGRYLRFLMQAGGAASWVFFVHESYNASGAELEPMLPFLTGKDAEAQRLAVWGSLCKEALFRHRPEEAKALCQWGKENLALFAAAMEQCTDFCQSFSQDEGRQTRVFLTAVYLHHVQPETEEAAEMAAYLERWLTDGVSVAIQLGGSAQQGMLAYVKDVNRDAPFPRQLLDTLRGKRGGINRGWVAVIAGCAFLAIRHSVRFEKLLRLMVAADVQYAGRENTALQICMKIAGDDWWDERMAELEEMLPMEDDQYVTWCMWVGYDRGVRRVSAGNPEAVREAGRHMESEDYSALAEAVGDGNPALYEELRASYKEVFCEKTTREIAGCYYPGQDEAAGYLQGKNRVDTLGSFMADWEGDHYLNEAAYRKIENLRKIGARFPYRRALVLEALRKGNGYFRQYRIAGREAFPEQETEAVAACPEFLRFDRGNHGQKDVRERAGSAEKNSLLTEEGQVGALVRLLEEEAVPVPMALEALGGMADTLKEKQEKALFTGLCVKLLSEKVQSREDGWEAGIEEAVTKGGAAACCLALQVLAQDWVQYREQILSCAGNGARQVQALLLQICEERREWEPQILALLASKKAREREFAVLTVETWGIPSHLDKIREALDKEKNKKVKALLEEVGEELEAQAAAEAAAAENPGQQQRIARERFAAGLLRGAAKRKVEWVMALPLPEVHCQDGTPVSPEYMLALCAVYGDMEKPGMDENVTKLVQPLDQKELSGYVYALYEGWLGTGGEAKKRWVLYAFSFHGGRDVVPELYKQIREWSENSRGAMAAEAVQAMVLHGSQEALLLADQMSRKFKSRQVKNAAAAALEAAADQLHISRAELEDKLVPDLGFNRDMEQIFDYGPRTFTVRLNVALEAEVYDESGKRLKNIPAPGKKDDPEKAAAANSDFKQMKRQLRSVVASQKLRLEQALISVRFWQAEKWEELFVRNPIMHLFATGLIWGVYENGALKETFRYMEDGSFNTVDEEEFAFPGDGMIGLVHPLELKEELDAWKQQLSDYDVIQPFAQLERPVYEVNEEEKGSDSKAVTRFYGTEVNGWTLSSRLLAAGWMRGEILDAGCYMEFYRSDGDAEAELTFSGSSVGYEFEDVMIYELHFYGHTETGEGASHQKMVQIPLSQVSPRYFSEIVLQVANVAETSGSEDKDV